MQNVYDLVDQGQLTAFIRGLIFPDLILGRWLPNVPVDRTHYRYALNDRQQRPAARYISYDAEAPIGSRPGLSIKMGELPPIKQKNVLTESDQILNEGLVNAGVLSEPMLATVFSDAALGARAILQRLELAKGEALSKGQVTISEGGLLLPPIAFGTPSPQLSVIPGTLWSDVTNSTPLTDMIAWRQLCINNSGFTPQAAIVSQQQASYLQRNAEVVGAWGNQRKRVTRDELNQLLESEALPPITVYEAQYKNTSGSLTRPIDANRFVWLPADGQGFGQTQMGRTREAVELAGQQVDLAPAGGTPGLVAVTMKSFDPVEIWTKAAAIALPVIETPDQMFSAVVF